MRMRKRERIRRSGIGGSDIAAVFGLSPWKTRYALYLEKTAVPEEEIPPRPTGGTCDALLGASAEEPDRKSVS